MSKTVVVIGASRGIGCEVVKQFATQNYEVIAISRDIDTMKSEFSNLEKVHPYKIDLLSKSLRSDFESVISKHDKIDILINNAGKLVNKPFDKLTHEDLTESYQVNIIGIMEVTQIAVKRMKKAHIVNISSIGGFQGSLKFPGLAAYSTSKAALVSFTELFAEEFKETEISMNCLCLGAVQTEMLAEAFPGYEAPLSASKMSEYIVDFSLNADQWMRGKIIPVSTTNP